jgi:NADPH2:quinone reductase
MLAEVKARIGVPVPVGNEGSGTVVRAGRSAAAQALLGKTVAAIGGAMYCQYRRVNVAAVLPLGEGVSAKQGAACFVNPMTALAMTECMALEGYKGIVHTAAASNLGQILNRICMADGINLVNIVRKEDQAELLRQAGAKYVVNSSSDNFREELSAAIAATEAYVCFDAIGGGSVQDDILFAMESAATNGQGTIGPYGSDTFKQIYVYGGLNPEPTVLKRNYGFTWAVSGWLTSFLLRKIGAEKVSAMRSRVAAEIDTTFASFFHDEVSLAGALQAENIARFSKQSTGTKFLINPSME